MASADLPAPEPLACSAQVMAVDFHPLADVIACATIAGPVEVFRYSRDGHQPALRLTSHRQSVRAARFTADGGALVTGSMDRSLRAADVNGATIWKEMDAHTEPINALQVLGQWGLASGDDEGCVKLWDLRQRACVATFDECEDYIADFDVNAAGTHLLAAAGDGTLSVFDLRNNTLARRSDQQDDELLSVTCLKAGDSKVVCGSQDGVLIIWSWGTWGDNSDRFPGHPESISALLRVDDDTLLTGSSDGIIRVVSVQPNRLLGVIGDHEDFPVESMAWSRDRVFVASTSHDAVVRLWDVAYLHEADSDGEGGAGGAGGAGAAAGASAEDDGATGMTGLEAPGGAGFWAGM